MRIVFTILCILFSLLLITCSSVVSKRKLVISTMNKYKPVFTEKDSLLFYEKAKEVKAVADYCKEKGKNCLIHFYNEYAEYAGGINKFRTTVFDSLDIPKNTKPAKYTVNFNVGRKHRIENIKVRGPESEMKNEIIRVMNIDVIKNKWSSAYFYSRFCEECLLNSEYEFEIEINRKNFR